MRRKHKKAWNMAEVKLIKQGIIPEGRTYRAVQQFCSRCGLIFPGKRWKAQNGLER